VRRDGRHSSRTAGAGNADAADLGEIESIEDFEQVDEAIVAGVEACEVDPATGKR
jgi:hypothetical protein